MKNRVILFSKIFLVLIGCTLLYSFFQKPATNNSNSNIRFPFREAGLTDRQAAAHMLSRFSFGAQPGQIDEVLKIGLENWFIQQLNGGIKDDSLQIRLAEYDALNLTNVQVNEVFPRPIQVIRMAREEGVIPMDSATDIQRAEYKKELAAYVKQKKFRRQGELFRQLINNKIIRAAYSNNQLQEVLTDFWFNHFNVSLTKKDCALFIPAFERDVIRPNITGKFEDILLSTAKSPAMLLYLDNFNSVSSKDENGQVDNENLRRRIRKTDPSISEDSITRLVANVQQKRRKNQGLNENYAREVMELHTLGVDGGYTQTDVTQAARILTGWTLYPLENSYGSGIRKLIEKIGDDKLLENGFVHDGDFLFAMNKHDRGRKTVLGKNFDENGGYQEGVELLKMLAHHPSTAKFICKKLAVHFVNDNPPNNLIDKMAKTFLEKDGDIKEVLLTMACSSEFWSKESIRQKTKSPFELAVSTARMLQADIQQPYQLFSWIERMGQRIYYYQAPTGFPDKAEYWINTGALLNRMNFGLAISSNQIRGVSTNLLKLNLNHEPESSSDALLTYSKLLMPERDLSETIRRLTPILTQPALEKKLGEVTDKSVTSSENGDTTGEMLVENIMRENEKPQRENKRQETDKDNMLAQVVGVIIGSPEFQRK